MMNITLQDWIFFAAGGILALAGITMAALALFKDRSKGRRRCPKCWYDMSGVPGLLCPECGKTAKAERSLFQTRRQWGLFGAGFVVMLIGISAALTPRVREQNWPSIVPLPVLNLLVAIAGDDAQNDAFESVHAVLMGQTRNSQAISPWRRLLAAAGSGDKINELEWPAFQIPTLSLMMSLTDIQGVLVECGREAKLAVPILIDLCKNGQMGMERSFGYAWLGSIAPDVPSAKNFLIEQIEDSSQGDGRLDAARALCIKIQYGDPAFWKLVGIMHDDADLNVRMSIMDLLATNAFPQSIGPIQDVLKNDPDSFMKANAAEHLLDLRQAVSLELGDLLHDERPETRVKAAELLAKKAYNPELVMDQLLSALDDPSSEVVEFAVEALGRIGAQADRAIPRLWELAKEHPKLRRTIGTAISAIRTDIKSGN